MHHSPPRYPWRRRGCDSSHAASLNCPPPRHPHHGHSSCCRSGLLRHSRRLSRGGWFDEATMLDWVDYVRHSRGELRGCLRKCLQAPHVRHEVLHFHVRPGNLWGGGGRRTGILNLNLDAEWVIMHAHNAWAPSGGTALLDKGTLEALPGIVPEQYEQMGICHIVVECNESRNQRVLC